MTDNEIVKALECCGKNHILGKMSECKDCHFKNSISCITELIYQSLDLINRQKAELEKNENIIRLADKTIETANAEIENLKDILYDAEGVNLVNYWHQQCGIAENGCKNFAEENKNLKAEIERLKAKVNHFQYLHEIFTTTPTNRIKAEAYKECIEKVKEKSKKTEVVCSGALITTNYAISAKNLNNLLKEMIGE